MQHKPWAVEQVWTEVESEIIKNIGLELWKKHPPRIWKGFIPKRLIRVSQLILEKRLKEAGCHGFKRNQVVLNRWMKDLVYERYKIIISKSRSRVVEYKFYKILGWHFIRYMEPLEEIKINQIVEEVNRIMGEKK